ncbi:serine hydrolase domain-containing protein [Mycobacterium haemophilum]|uniref:Beta-lactamase n=1 Tax=Mycobacterium haemophilum TaxID=29311 RepID=A0A0I9TTZ1_9MYCO|nr:serine hydrolase domain-containing protein [Mycobacterium haemophilum]KLO31985.1 beta-lactamase [Mycobacterium haemophilum]KLO36337.1 beta-lactamase [Mycobacterium haemophilum]KLO42221.1 beta-lactamase [Mycobacterium haemophilum]KLO50023.1 beta-lactamase [Mycobacterium haemophilum]
MAVLDALDDWPVPAAAAAVVGPTGVLAAHGDTEQVFALASVTKPLVARAAQIAVEEGVVDLDTAAGPPGSTVRHLLAHASGLAMHSKYVMAPPGTRRMYSNYGFRVLAETVQRESGIEFGRYLTEAVFEPLAMAATKLEDGAWAAGFGATSTVADLAAFATDLLRPATVSAHMHADATSVQFPGLDGVLPGYGVQRPNDWGLGFEIKDSKSPHWTGTLNSARTYGHFGQSGGFIWADPEAELVLVVLTDRDFGEWALQLWPAISDAVLSEYTR